jgi:hypothetical protein
MGGAALLERIRTIRIGYGLIASTGSPLALSASLTWTVGPATPGTDVPARDEATCALLETPSVSMAWPRWIAMIAAPIAIPTRIETTATRSSRRALGAGQK